MEPRRAPARAVRRRGRRGRPRGRAAGAPARAAARAGPSSSAPARPRPRWALALERPLAGRAVRPDRDPLRPRRALRADRGGRGRASGARRGRASRGRAASSTWCGGLGEDDLVLAPDLGRRLGAADRCRPTGLTLADKQAHQPGAAALGRLDRRDELRAQAPLARSRAAGSRRRRCPARTVVAADLRRARRRPGGDRQRPDRARPDHAAADALAILARYGIELPDSVRAASGSAPRPRRPSRAIRASPAPRPG